jgi:hypothetical protein
LRRFQVAARGDGFVEVADNEDESVAWFRSMSPDAETNVHKRLCLDSLTRSATIYWETAGAKLNSKTFRTASSMKAWLSLNPARSAEPVNNAG